MSPGAASRYDRIIEEVFVRAVGRGAQRAFTMSDLVAASRRLGLPVKNPMDVIYSYQAGRRPLPAGVAARGNWSIEPSGKGQYAFVRQTVSLQVEIPPDLEAISIPDATPEVVYLHCGSDEQALLAKVRYCRLVDTFTGLAAWHLQGHFKTAVPDYGQVEVDELYLGVNRDGRWAALPVEAKARREHVGKRQVVSLTMFGRHNFATLDCRPIVVKEAADGSIFLIEFTPGDTVAAVKIREIKRYRLVREGGR